MEDYYARAYRDKGRHKEWKQDEQRAKKPIPISVPNVSSSKNLNPNNLLGKSSYQEKYESLLQNFKSLENENIHLKEAIAKIKKEFISYKQKEISLEQKHSELLNALNKNNSYSISNLQIDINNIDISADLIINDSKDFKDSITCIICLGVVRNPLNCKKCDCTFCTKCINTHLIRDSRCPHCQQPFKHRNNKFLNNILDLIKISCPSKCNESFAYSEITKHLEKCDKRMRMFKCDQCKTALNANKLNDPNIEEHNQNCKASILNCIYCNTSAKRQVLGDHLKRCPKRILKCDLCKTSYPADDHIAHYNYYCEISKFYKSIEELIFKL